MGLKRLTLKFVVLNAALRQLRDTKPRNIVVANCGEPFYFVTPDTGSGSDFERYKL